MALLANHTCKGKFNIWTTFFLSRLDCSNYRVISHWDIYPTGIHRAYNLLTITFPNRRRDPSVCINELFHCIIFTEPCSLFAIKLHFRYLWNPKYWKCCFFVDGMSSISFLAYFSGKNEWRSNFVWILSQCISDNVLSESDFRLCIIHRSLNW